MKQALMERGVPESDIILDYAGFRTLDSVVRCKKVFGQERMTIISQGYHNARAIYLRRVRVLMLLAVMLKILSEHGPITSMT